MEPDIQGRLVTEFYEKFSAAMDEYMFLAMTEDCHPLIDRCEQIVCAMDNIEYKSYCEGETEYEDGIRYEAHRITQDIMRKMLRRYADGF